MKVPRIAHVALAPLLLSASPICLALEDAIIEQLNNASRLIAQKQWDRASETYQDVLKADPNNVHALVGEARLCAGQKRWKRAIELLERAKKLLPAQGDVREVTEWHVVGPFANPGDGDGLDIPYPPEKGIKLDAIYDGKPGAVSAAKGAMATLRKGCMACHRMCKVSVPQKAMKGKLSLPKTPAAISAFVAGQTNMKSLMMAHQMACDLGAKAADGSDVETAALAGAIMKAVQLRASEVATKNQKFVAAGKVFCVTAAALEAVERAPEEIGWQKMSRDEVLHLEKLLPIDNVIFYGLATVSSDTQQVVELRVGSDDGCKVWFNDQHVWTNRARRPVDPDQDRIIVKMRKGQNKLLMKLEQGGMHYGMGARIVRSMNVVGALQRARQEYNKVKNNAFVRVSPNGLKPDSPRQFWVYKGKRCVKKGVIGRTEIVPPGKYQIRIGFTSGHVVREIEAEKGEELTVPTGLFRFQQATPANLVSTVPQKLYHLPSQTYLVTGYQGMTSRLYPGQYRVCYQDLNDEKPSTAFGTWHVLGVFPNPKLNKGFNVAYPPEKEPIPDLGRTYQSMGQKIGWKRLPDALEVEITRAIPKWGVAYATAAIESDDARGAELVMTTRCGIKAWLNGDLITTVPPAKRSYYTRKATFVKLKKGRNVLFVKTLRTSYAWPLSAIAVRWKMYDVDVVAETD